MVERIFLVRHAETVANTMDLVQGALDSELTEKGVMQALAMGKALENEKIDVIYSSDTGRVRQTLRESGLDRKFKVVYTKELRERNYGVMENKAWRELNDEESKIYKRHDLRPEGGESIEDVGARAVPFVNKLLLGKEESAMMLTHHNTIAPISCFFMGLPLYRWRIFRTDNTSISEFYYRDDIWRIMRINDVSHLNSIA